MIVYDSGQFFWNWDVKVLGLDVDESALEKARRGLYHHNSFRGDEPGTLEKHFVPDGSGVRGEGADPAAGELPAGQHPRPRELRGAARRWT